MVSGCLTGNWTKTWIFLSHGARYIQKKILSTIKNFPQAPCLIPRSGKRRKTGSLSYEIKNGTVFTGYRWIRMYRYES